MGWWSECCQNCSPVKVMKTLTKLINIKISRTLERNLRLEKLQRMFVQESSVDDSKNIRLTELSTCPSALHFFSTSLPPCDGVIHQNHIGGIRTCQSNSHCDLQRTLAICSERKFAYMHNPQEPVLIKLNSELSLSRLL